MKIYASFQSFLTWFCSAKVQHSWVKCWMLHTSDSIKFLYCPLADTPAVVNSVILCIVVSINGGAFFGENVSLSFRAVCCGTKEIKRWHVQHSAKPRLTFVIFDSTAATHFWRSCSVIFVSGWNEDFWLVDCAGQRCNAFLHRDRQGHAIHMTTT